MTDLLLDIADAARRSGLKVIELPGWKSNYSNGGFKPLGVLNHHTGSYDGIADPKDDYDYAMWLAFKGRSDLPPPLCNVALSAECVVYVCAAGNANHAGRARASGPMPPVADGNSIYLGIEAMNSGSQGWTSKGVDASGKEVTQYEALVRLNAAFDLHYGWPASHDRGHKETSVTGKIDPAPMDMAAFRADVAEAMAPKPTPPQLRRHYGLVNLGRDSNPKQSSTPLDLDVLRIVKDRMPEERCVIFWCEINEGDDNNEWALIRRTFPGWKMYGGGKMRVREPVLFSPDMPAPRVSIRWVPNTAVPHWSPMRSMMRLYLPDGETLLAWHNAAGAYGQGTRPKKYQQALNNSFDATTREYHRSSNNLHRKGRNVTWMADTNSRGYPLIGNEEQVTTHGVDHGRVRPAKGFAADFREQDWVRLGLDTHGLLRMSGRYIERG